MYKRQDYMNAMEQENALLGELTFAAPESDTIDKYADAVQDTAAAWERLRSAETDGSTQSEVLKQVIDRTMKSYRVRQETFIAQLHDGTFDAVNYEALRTPVSYTHLLTKTLSSSRHLLALINDILDMSRIESGKLQLEETEVNLSEMLHDIKTIVGGQVHAKQLELYMDALDVTDVYKRQYLKWICSAYMILRASRQCFTISCPVQATHLCCPN